MCIHPIKKKKKKKGRKPQILGKALKFKRELEKRFDKVQRARPSFSPFYVYTYVRAKNRDRGNSEQESNKDSERIETEDRRERKRETKTDSEKRWKLARDFCLANQSGGRLFRWPNPRPIWPPRAKQSSNREGQVRPSLDQAEWWGQLDRQVEEEWGGRCCRP